MATIADACTACFEAFESLLAVLNNAAPGFVQCMPSRSVSDEYGRLRIWCGNLGVLQKGNAALDVRLRDSTVIRGNVSTLLAQLHGNLLESIAVISEARLPYEEQGHLDKSGDSIEQTNSSDDFDDDDGDSDGSPASELQMRRLAIHDVLDHCYKLSFSIRNPASRPESSQAALYRDLVAIQVGDVVDNPQGTYTISPETHQAISEWLVRLEVNGQDPVLQDTNHDPSTDDGKSDTDETNQLIDTFDIYAIFDQSFMVDLLKIIYTNDKASIPTREDTSLHERLIRAITTRRRQMRYWSKHSNKLAGGIWRVAKQGRDRLVDGTWRVADFGQSERHIGDLANKTFAPPTVYTNTNYSFRPKFEDKVMDNQSVISHASTALGLDGNAIAFPPPPKAAREGKDFICPYCSILCPAKQGNGKYWKTHILRDIRPYMCTYGDCDEADRMYGSRTQWLQHEATSHRKVWRCHQHDEAVYHAPAQLMDHLRTIEKFSETDVGALMEFAESSLKDERSSCPICFADAGPFPRGIQNHLANHLERIALFALPRGTDDNDGESAPGTNIPVARNDASQDISLTETLVFSEDRVPDDDRRSGDDGVLEAPERFSEVEERERDRDRYRDVLPASRLRSQSLLDVHRPSIQKPPCTCTRTTTTYRDQHGRRLTRKECTLCPNATDGTPCSSATTVHFRELEEYIPDKHSPRVEIIYSDDKYDSKGKSKGPSSNAVEVEFGLRKPSFRLVDTTKERKESHRSKGYVTTPVSASSSRAVVYVEPTTHYRPEHTTPPHGNVRRVVPSDTLPTRLIPAPSGPSAITASSTLATPDIYSTSSLAGLTVTPPSAPVFFFRSRDSDYASLLKAQATNPGSASSLGGKAVVEDEENPSCPPALPLDSESINYYDSSSQDSTPRSRRRHFRQQESSPLLPSSRSRSPDIVIHSRHRSDDHAVDRSSGSVDGGDLAVPIPSYITERRGQSRSPRRPRGMDEFGMTGDGRIRVSGEKERAQEE